MATVITSAPTWEPLIKRPARDSAPDEAVRSLTTEIEDLIRLTSQAAEKAFPELWEALTEAGRRNFVSELVEAGMSDDPRKGPGHVIMAWYNTLIIRSDPNYEKSAAQARRRTRHRKGATVDELRRQLG